MNLFLPHLLKPNIPKNDVMKIYNPQIYAPLQELSGGGLGLFVALLVGWKMVFVHLHWSANPAVNLCDGLQDNERFFIQQWC